MNAVSAITAQGTWLPGFAGDTGLGTPTYSVQAGTYEQIGRQVTARFYIQTTAITAVSGNVIISNLPFICNTTLKGFAVLSLVSGWTPGGAYTTIAGTIDNTTNFIRLFNSGPGAAAAAAPIGNFAAASLLAGFANYTT